MDFISPQKMLFVSVIGLLFGGYMLYTWFPIAGDRNYPIVTGTIKQRTPIDQSGIPRVHFEIELHEPHEIVHAYTQRYLIDEVPDQVKFRYSGDPHQEVFLFEHEENPLWIALFCFVVSIFLGVSGVLGLRSQKVHT